jgi:hypothetical protein
MADQSNESKSLLDEVNHILAIIYFTIALLVSLFVLIRTRFKLEWTMHAIILAYLVSFFLRMDLVDFDQTIQYFIYVAAC